MNTGMPLISDSSQIRLGCFYLTIHTRARLVKITSNILYVDSYCGRDISGVSPCYCFCGRPIFFTHGDVTAGNGMLSLADLAGGVTVGVAPNNNFFKFANFSKNNYQQHDIINHFTVQ